MSRKTKYVYLITEYESGIPECICADMVVAFSYIMGDEDTPDMTKEELHAGVNVLETTGKYDRPVEKGMHYDIERFELMD